MSLKTLMIITAIVALVFGILFIIIPVQFLSLYGSSPDAPLKSIGQLFGTALLGFGLLTWSARNAAESDARKAIVFALFVSNGIGFIVSLIAQLSNVWNQLGWSTVAIYLLLTLGWGYFQFSKSSS